MKKIIFLGAVILCIIIINGLVRSIYDLWRKQDLVVSAQKDLETAKKENQRLQKDLSYVKSNEFIESEARDKLFMVKPGESGVIIPPNLIAKKALSPTPEPSNWQKWINLFGF